MFTKKYLLNNNWSRNHWHDQYVIKAKKINVRSRAWFKLDEIDKKNKIFKSGMTVIDLGASPGSWSQFAINKIGISGKVIACDILSMIPIPGVKFLQGNLEDMDTINTIFKILNYNKVNIVMSDMSPNISGIPAIDIPKARYLNEIALTLSNNILIAGGSFIVKVFHGDGFNEYCKKIFKFFLNVKTYKPKASLSKSREVYIIATGYKT
uniref:Ribosomal RNA large subunit methyltransferase E n=1 Tax=Candidatus Aschnera chinzeii TaxID=1485666 RepID=A0AAT9G554_9ENTR|nr:MAG: 23S rRNA (uridine(2552)-2'-O)-methyltransferase RlmE [Candidatus Aschnera chinzeii]